MADRRVPNEYVEVRLDDGRAKVEAQSDSLLRNVYWRYKHVYQPRWPGWSKSDIELHASANRVIIVFHNDHWRQTPMNIRKDASLRSRRLHSSKQSQDMLKPPFTVCYQPFAQLSLLP